MKKKEKEKDNSLLGRVKMGFKKIMISNIIINMLFLILGLIIYMNPYMTAQAVGILIGIFFMISGIFNFCEFFLRDETPIFSFNIIYGILAFILGIFVIINPFRIVKILTFTLGLYLILVALFKGIQAFKFKKYSYDGWLLMLVMAILLMIFGVFITINPMAAMDVVQAAAIFIILASILEIANYLMLYSRAQEILNLINNKKS